jgi:hypothetical protein
MKIFNNRLSLNEKVRRKETEREVNIQIEGMIERKKASCWGKATFAQVGSQAIIFAWVFCR